MMQAPPKGTQFGALPRVTRFDDGTFPNWSRRFRTGPLIDRRVWRPVNMNRHVERIRRQLDGMCTANGAASAVEIERSIRGRPGPELSAEHLYLMNNRWGAGSPLDGILSDLIEPGVIAMSDVAGEQIADKRSFPPDHEILAGKNRMLEWVDLDADFDVVAVALQRYRPCLIGVNWPGGGGHAVACTELVKFTREVVHKLSREGWEPPRGLKYDSHGVRGPNSWGEGWGEPPGYSAKDLEWLAALDREPLEGGFYTLTERECRDFSVYGCWAAGSST